MKIAVVALGKIGLPLAVQFAQKGHDVIGIDVQEAVVSQVNAGREPFPGEAHLQERLSEVVQNGRLRATTKYEEAVPQADVVVLVVPLFVDEATWEPDFEWMDGATKSLAKYLTEDTLVSYETTLPVGTTRQRWMPMLEEGSGLREGSDFHLVFSPERVLTGRVFDDLRKYPKLIGALSDAGRDAAIEFYESVLDFDSRPDLAPSTNGVWDLGTAEAAELAKLAETTYRDVNIGLANQFARFSEEHGIDVYSVIDAANSQPYSHIHRPGIAVGGHCIPVYPRLYLHTDPEATIVRAAREANMGMPKHAVNLTKAAVGGSLDGITVVVFGATYRGRVKETAFSGVFPLVRHLTDEGAIVTVRDPMYSLDELNALELPTAASPSTAEAIIVQADHPEYKRLTPEQFPNAKVLLDGRNFTDAAAWQGINRIVIGA